MGFDFCGARLVLQHGWVARAGAYTHFVLTHSAVRGPFLPAYARYNATPAMFPNAHRNQSTVLSLPMFPEMTDAQQDHVVQCVRDFCGGAR